MTDAAPSFDRNWQYRFSRPDGVEIETREFNGDDPAEAFGRELSKAQEVPVVIERQGRADWEYLTEVDERP
jgi:hypothetical protein